MESAVAELPLQFFGLLALEQTATNIDFVQIVSRVAHILSAIILVGGLFYLRTVLAPAGADACFADRRAVWAKWVGITSALLLASGLFNFFVIRNEAIEAGTKLLPMYNMLFGIKFLVALLLMFVASILAGRTALAGRFRQKIKMWLNIGLLAAVAIVVMAAVLRALH